MAPSKVDVGRRQVPQALVVSVVIVVFHEALDAGVEIAGHEVGLQQDAVLQGLVPAFYLALGLWVIRSATNMIHALTIQPVCKLA